MLVVHHAHLESRREDGGSCLVAAGREQGIAGFEVRVLVLEPGGSSAEQRHAGELVGVALQGSGKLVVDGGPQRFHAPCSLLIPARAAFRVANVGSASLQVVWVATRPPQTIDAAARAPDSLTDPSEGTP